jgi:hypothetical protein
MGAILGKKLEESPLNNDVNCVSLCGELVYGCSLTMADAGLVCVFSEPITVGMVMQRALLASLLLISALTWEASTASIPSEEGTDSLRGALEALDRRQRALQQRPQFAQRQQHGPRYR